MSCIALSSANVSGKLIANNPQNRHMKPRQNCVSHRLKIFKNTAQELKTLTN